MIALSNDISPNLDTAEGIKLFEIFKCYNDIALFWKQENSDIFISLLDGNMIIDGKNADFSELKSFVDIISPFSVFSNETVLNGLRIFENSQKVKVLETVSYEKTNTLSDELSSGDVYEILKKSGLFVPEYEYFATDFCLRLNHGRLKYFGVKEKAVAVSIGSDNVLIQAMASLEKGLGTVCLKGLMAQNHDKKILVCAREEVKEFYTKNGFAEVYSAGYWRKK